LVFLSGGRKGNGKQQNEKTAVWQTERMVGEEAKRTQVQRGWHVLKRERWGEGLGKGNLNTS